jgi:hypothetical protein
MDRTYTKLINDLIKDSKGKNGTFEITLKIHNGGIIGISRDNKTKTKTIKNDPPVEKKFRVEVIEHDRWSGPSKPEIHEFVSMSEASKYAQDINSENTATMAPDYYVTASILSK